MTAWHLVWETGRTVSAIVVGLGAPGLVLWFVRDRRKDQAAASVAEQTVVPEVEIKETGALEARLVYVQREMDLERGFHQQQLVDRDAEIERQRGELQHSNGIIAGLRAEVAELQQQVAAVTRRLSEVLEQLTELADHTTTQGGH